MKQRIWPLKNQKCVFHDKTKKKKKIICINISYFRYIYIRIICYVTIYCLKINTHILHIQIYIHRFKLLKVQIVCKTPMNV